MTEKYPSDTGVAADTWGRSGSGGLALDRLHHGGHRRVRPGERHPPTPRKKLPPTPHEEVA
jgi:hypothetical protein